MTNTEEESGSKILKFSTASRPDIAEAVKNGTKVIPVEVEDQMKDAYLGYAMSVIVGRALPDVRDGLKPVHRRILHAMNERAWRSDKAYVKCAKIVGEVLGNYHPHGDSSVYDALVRMVQDFSLRVPLIDGQGNFGSVDGDNAAAYRYTEARLAKMAEELLRDIDKDTVNFSPNFDDTKEQPDVLPANFPNILVNGTSGIAVGMATNIPPHNLQETIAAVVEVIKNPDIGIRDLIKIIKGPDFPTGATVIGGEGLLSAYTTGKGSIRIRSKVEIEETSKGREVIVITEIPYQVNKKVLLEKIGELVNEKLIEGISEILDLSNRNGMRVELHIKKDYNSQVILNQLFKLTQMQVSYGITMLAILNNKPKIFNLKEILHAFSEHRRDVIVRRTRYELKKAEERAHILEGLKIALDNIDEVIRIIRASKNPAEAKTGLMNAFPLTEVQTDAILDMRLQRLTSLEVQKIIDELEEIRKLIADLKDILDKPARVSEIIINELQTVSDKFGTPRKTEISNESIASTSFEAQDLIDDEDVVIQISEDQFIKRLPIDTFKRQKRGGKGVQGASTKRDDFIKIIRIASTHDTIMLFSNRGKAFMMKVYELPVGTKEARGKSLKAIINLGPDEVITSICTFKEFTEDAILMATKNGIIKKSPLSAFANTKKNGIIAIGLDEKDQLIYVNLLKPEQDILIASKNGLAVRTNLAKLRTQGRSAGGVRGMRLSEGDFVTGVTIVEKDSDLIVITEKGYGKRSEYSEFATKGRGGRGMTYLKITEKNGGSIGVASIKPTDEVIIIAQSGMIIRMEAKDISVIGRSTQGVRVVNLKDDDVVVDFAVLESE
ncbi:MAG TPA: DNA gyrase subunit A [Leptospiraceae bacterium]|nr:DNA gyrase subunit A [Leptospiraceae bacterium]HMW04514.1 DNA gyrase subunit A [Leptospiraceae bacterium]HMX31172.1 DNA gyrase subunit A [Leptospiraceae bacterium]HMY30700.1 DNA gyrase subunit A [Leptospiraceae bacterium]HMZ63231.1 DNA gyrase subunit A [Leptospiraceae bacterium]